MKVYILRTDGSHLVDMSYDVSLIRFDGSEDMKYQLQTETKVDRPGPIQFVANIRVVAELDYPISDSGIVVMSKKMVDALENVAEIKWNVLPTILIDDTFLKDRYDENGMLLPEVNVLKDFYVVQLLEQLSVFDFDHSDYKVLRSNPAFPGVVKKMVYGNLKGDPPIFRMAEKPASLFLSQPAKEARDKNNIKGCLFQEVEVSN